MTRIREEEEVPRSRDSITPVPLYLRDIMALYKFYYYCYYYFIYGH